MKSLSPRAERYGLAGLLFLLGLLARLPNWGRSGFWLDECITAYRVVDLHTVFTMNDASPWFYPLVVYVSTLFLGATETGLRLPSLLAGAALGPALFLILRSRWSRSSSLFIGLLGVFNPLSLHYAQEARVYAVAMLLAVVWFGLLRELLYPVDEEPPAFGVVAGLVVLSPMLALCHHYCLFVGAAGLLVAILRLAGCPDLRKMALKPLLAAYGLTLALWLPTMFLFTLSHAKMQVDAKFNPYAPHAPPDIVFRFALGTPLNPFRNFDLVCTAAVVLGTAMLFLALGRSRERSEWAWGTQYLFCLLVTVAAHSVVPSYVGGRYDTPFLGIALVTLGLAVVSIPNLNLRYMVMALILLSQVMGCARFWWITMPKSACRSMAQFIATEKPDLVLCTLPKDFDALYLMPMVYYVHRRLGSEIPIMEIPRFKEVPDEFVSPSVHYLLYQELQEIPREETLGRLRETLEQHGEVAILGLEPQMAALGPVLNDYVVKKGVFFQGYNEGKTLVLIVGDRKASEGAPAQGSN